VEIHPLVELRTREHPPGCGVSRIAARGNNGQYPAGAINTFMPVLSDLHRIRRVRGGSSEKRVPGEILWVEATSV
jgi:hypothetical protein